MPFPTRPSGKQPSNDLQLRNSLFQDLLESTERATAASNTFNNVLGQYPSGLPYPHGSEQLNGASENLTTARKQMADAHNRLNDYLARGIAPEDWKQA